MSRKIYDTPNGKHLVMGFKLKIEALGKLGGKCSFCGLTDYRCLEIDHIENNGADHREELFGDRRASGTHFYRWVINNPEEARRLLHVLCANCHRIGHFEEGKTKIALGQRGLLSLVSVAGMGTDL